MKIHLVINLYIPLEVVLFLLEIHENAVSFISENFKPEFFIDWKASYVVLRSSTNGIASHADVLRLVAPSSPETAA